MTRGPRVRPDPRPHGLPRPRRLGQGLLWRLGVIHALWKPMPGPLQGLHRDAQGQHVSVAAHHGDRARGPAAGDPDPHPGDAPTAEYGIAAHWSYKEASGRSEDRVEWLKQLVDWQKELQDPQEFVETLKVDLFEDEVFVFTPKGEVKSLPPAPRRSTSPTRSTPRWATAAWARGQRQDRAAPLPAAVGRHCEVLTSKKERGRRATGWRSPRPRARSRRSAPGSSASGARTPSAPAARSSENLTARASRRRRSPARRCSPT